MSMFSSVNVSQSGSTIGCRSKELQRKNEKTWWTTIRFESHISEMKMSFSDLGMVLKLLCSRKNVARTRYRYRYLNFVETKQ